MSEGQRYKYSTFYEKPLIMQLSIPQQKRQHRDLERSGKCVHATFSVTEENAGKDRIANAISVIPLNCEVTMRLMDRNGEPGNGKQILFPWIKNVIPKLEENKMPGDLKDWQM